MFNPFEKSEKNLGRAGWLLVLAVLTSIALAFVLVEFGANSDVAVFVTWSFMPFVAWFMSKAAQVQGRNALLYGLASLLPPLAILAFYSLYSRDVEIRLNSQGASQHET